MRAHNLHTYNTLRTVVQVWAEGVDRVFFRHLAGVFLEEAGSRPAGTELEVPQGRPQPEGATRKFPHQPDAAIRVAEQAISSSVHRSRQTITSRSRFYRRRVLRVFAEQGGE